MTLTETISRDKKILGEKIPCVIETLTPVHVGSGVKLSKGFDFYVDRNETTLVPQSAVMNYLQTHLNEVKNFSEISESVLKKVKEQGRTFKLNCTGQDIFEFERDGNASPYIPASSLKGAMRTVLVKELFQNLSKESQGNEIIRGGAKKEWASDSLLKTLFGTDPNHNLMRVLAPSDAVFQEDNLILSEVQVMNLVKADASEYKWKLTLFVESLKASAKANFSLRLDDFLFSPKAETELHFKKYTLEDLAIKINRYSRQRLQDEAKFFKGFSGLEKVEVAIEKLIEKVPAEKSEAEKSEFVIRLGWGSGWKSMTGDFLDEKQLSEIRNEFRLGHKNMPFPKTRKVVFEEGIASSVCGWIKVRLHDSVTIAKPEETVSVFVAPVDLKFLESVNANSRNIPAEVIDNSKSPIQVKIFVIGYENIFLPCSGVTPAGFPVGTKISVEVNEFDKLKKRIKSLRFQRKL